jgi:hypothetical protein
MTDDRRAAMAFAVRRMTGRPEAPLLTRQAVQSLFETASLPAPGELLDVAVLWFGQHSTRAGQEFDVTYSDYRTALGSVDGYAFRFVADAMISSSFFDGQLTPGMDPKDTQIIGCRLSRFGWERFAELSRNQAQSRHAFMAMKYGDSQLDGIWAEHFAPEVTKAGFELRRLDQGQPAGLIDDQLRVMIRTSRFLVCDLTHGNRGAYWEAGFAEGLGKPVIYTCRRDVFDDRHSENHPHFDTNHMVTIPWDPADPARAARKLKDTVRATLPDEAKLND